MKALQRFTAWLRERWRRRRLIASWRHEVKNGPGSPPVPPVVHATTLRPRQWLSRNSTNRDRGPAWARSSDLSNLSGEGLRALASASAGLPTRSLQLPAPRRSRTHTRFGFYADGNLSNCPRGEGFE